VVLVGDQVSSVNGAASQIVAINSAMPTIEKLPTAQKNGICFFIPWELLFTFSGRRPAYTITFALAEKATARIVPTHSAVGKRNTTGRIVLLSDNQKRFWRVARDGQIGIVPLFRTWTFEDKVYHADSQIRPNGLVK
jgi:hypothetical protein